ncbi:NACHT domain-containing protein [Fusarium mundagurra]|uniref:NACHT domain-containing protein n=1 Tax=Fusarium mundagurra TaxID=1567541 RepID=A0A8H6DAM0_9HYPO|nr:NACHT domain-containing protein [Fusarium mundagurra]
MSGLEPLAALGLVCNIVQLVEVGLKTATLCKNAYRTGEPDPELSVYAQSLADTASSLTESLELSKKPLNPEDVRLLTLARNCRDTEAEWRKKTPARFLSQQQPRKRDRFGAVLRGIINKPEIDRLESQLEKAKECLEIGLIIGVFQRLDIYRVQTDDLQDKLQTLLHTTSASGNNLHELIQKQVTLISTKVSERIDKAEASNKTHVTTELASHELRVKSHAEKGRDNLLKEAEAREKIRRENEDYERLLYSFHYPDMNHRRNDIHSSHTSTFGWIFRGELEQSYMKSDATHPYSLPQDTTETCDQEPVCCNFAKWLQSTGGRYWISGRPGTGKSVLMKFIISHEKTIDSLRQWQPCAQVLTHFFWKVGSAMQSSFKGFLCSIIHQMFSLDREHAMSGLQQQPDWSRKTGPGDWDNDELQSIITSYLSLSGQPFCLFIDGLDEFMDETGVGILIGFLDSLQRSSPLLKICMSSRPEQAIRIRLSRDPDLKMQDLTRHDIECYSRAVLSKEIVLVSSSVDVEDIVKDISDKAKGVFLWAVLVTRSVARGISNGDSREDIQKRLLKTPKKLYELYFDMWTRLGEDSDLYQEPAALIFKIVLFVWRASRGGAAGRALATLGRTVSILELTVASSGNLWCTPVEDFDSLCTTNLEKRCNNLLTRLPIETADLFEVIDVTVFEGRDTKQSADKLRVAALKYNNLRVQAIHRSVFDFLIETADGHRIMEHHKASQEELFIRIFKACLLRDYLRSGVYFNARSYMTRIKEEDRRWYESDRRLDVHLESLSFHGDLVQASVLTEMLDIIWTSHVQKNGPILSNPNTTVHGGVPFRRFNYLLRVASMGFDTYLTRDLKEWENKRQFGVLHQVLMASFFGPHFYNNFQWAGRHRLIEQVIWIIASADRFYFSTPRGLHISNCTMAKTGMANFLISAMDAFRVSQHGVHHAPPWDASKTSAMIKTILDFRDVICFDDTMLVTLYFDVNRLDELDFISYGRHVDVEDAIYLEVSMSMLVQIFLRRVARYDGAFNRYEVEEALKLMLFSQTLKPTMLGVHKDVYRISCSADQTVLKEYCQVRLLPELFCVLSERLTEAISHAFMRVETICEIEEGIGPNGMNFYLCSSCKAREAT